MKDILNSNKAIILFDGLCNFCNDSVNFIIDRDNDDYFRFTSIQSEAGQNMIKRYKIDITKTDSIILIKDNKYYIKSTAALKISRKITSLWKLFYILIIIPRPLRDIGYDIIARNRYKWFGKRETCRIPTPDEMKKFLNY